MPSPRQHMLPCHPSAFLQCLCNACPFEHASPTHLPLAQHRYGLGAVDGLNEKGLAGNLLYFPDVQFGDPERKGRPKLSVFLWLQYALDNFATVKEAVSTAKQVAANNRQ